MIISFIIILVANIISFGFYALPTGTLPAGVSSAFASVISWIWVANIAVDIPTLISIVAIIFSIELALWSYKMLFWIYSKIPFIGRR